MAIHKPMMPAKEIQKRKSWQNKVYNELKSKKSGSIRIDGIEILYLGNVFAPIYLDSKLLAECVKKETKKGDAVLDIGTGCGIQAVFAAKKAEKVIATDINSEALKCTRLNAKRLKLESKIKTLKSDLFSKIRQKFDLIIFNPPFRWFKPRDILERGELDENYETLKEFFANAKGHLTKNGRIIIVFSSSGDIKYFNVLIQKHGFKKEVLAKKESNGWIYVVYRLTPFA